MHAEPSVIWIGRRASDQEKSVTRGDTTGVGRLAGAALALQASDRPQLSTQHIEPVQCSPVPVQLNDVPAAHVESSTQHFEPVQCILGPVQLKELPSTQEASCATQHFEPVQ